MVCGTVAIIYRRDIGEWRGLEPTPSTLASILAGRVKNYLLARIHKLLYYILLVFPHANFYCDFASNLFSNYLHARQFVREYFLVNRNKWCCMTCFELCAISKQLCGMLKLSDAQRKHLSMLFVLFCGQQWSIFSVDRDWKENIVQV